MSTYARGCWSLGDDVFLSASSIEDHSVPAIVLFVAVVNDMNK